MKVSLPAAAINISIIVIIIGVLTLTCQGRDKKPYRNIYTLKLDFTNINFSAVIPATKYKEAVEDLTLYSAGLSDIYSIGVKHYCKGKKIENGDYRITYCTSASQNYYFDPNTLIASEIKKANRMNHLLRDLVDTDIKLPSGVPWFKTKKSTIVTKVFISLLIGVLFAGIGFVLNMASMCFPLAQNVILGFSFLTSVASAISLLVGTAVATNVYDRTRKGFNNGYDEFGISATWGNSAFYGISWLITALQILFVTTIVCTPLAQKWIGERRGKRSKEPEVMDIESRRNRFISRFDRDSDAEDENVPRYNIANLPTYEQAVSSANANRLERG